ncbi:SDR family NAD(P)-dependent oxidoreductase [Cellulomonas chengniuliangii]|uniref:SDR family oxidoreductase n=1 Tax=Cellulomonas chengniuliangii TaxID=2968084 RepID=A0ABY5L026_9CELL|nr:SDR family oxidoreductase [Cellulomonas chengniuliangii]MCC2307461.1 SDR family oxidoreductase [Cellulomonas chengniuliangii]MCC2317958.1 SDR family oxidoreductase [Cellulomonas chengniuliangii]UUI75764.1 SDR family oxidoreductase [Cellulomonas chengniuliangii]
MENLEGRRALVTGAATGIGRATALALAQAGADIAFTHLTHDPAETVAGVEALGRRAIAYQLDARHSWDVDRVVVQAADELGGGIDILVNNAGGLGGRQLVTGMDDQHWHLVLDLNVSSVFYATRAVLPLMPDGGRIITISSLAGQNGGGTGAVAYATAKAALDGFTRALARELGPRGITVNSVAPGFIGGTPFHATHTPEPAQRAAVEGTPLKRAGTPEDVAAAVVYLASEGAGFVSGAVLDVNGGAYFR